MTATLNGKPQRKQLSDQLDRMDGIIDCLADALPEAVRDAVRDGTEAALKQVLLDLLTDPAIVDRLRQATAPNSPPAPSRTGAFFRRCGEQVAKFASQAAGQVRDTTSQLRSSLRAIQTRVARVVSESTANVRAVVGAFDLAWQLKKAVLIALGVGVAVATVATASHSAAAILAGAGAGMTTVAIQVGLWARRSLRMFAE